MPDRFWAKLEVDLETECWIWMATKNTHGYGLFSVDGRKGAAHRIAYSRLVSPLPDYTPAGPQLDHLCRVRACCNPAHLEVVSPRVNTLRGKTIAAARRAQDACIHGHAFSRENTIIRPDGTRGCHACQGVRNARRKTRQLVNG